MRKVVNVFRRGVAWLVGSEGPVPAVSAMSRRKKPYHLMLVM